MTGQPKFDFDDKGVPAAYDNVLVPLMFDPWAEALLNHVTPPSGSWVVDVATGTGIVAEKLAERVGPSGTVTATDISAEMLSLARRRCSNHNSNVHFVEGPAAPLPVDNDVADIVYCQQGFQFFPNKHEAAAEMFRILRPGGTVAVSTWCSVDQCVFFGAIYHGLRWCGEEEVAEMIAVPFNHMPAEELAGHFSSAGFGNIVLETREAELEFESGIDQAYETAFATPIGPRLRTFPGATLAKFREFMVKALSTMTDNGVTSTNLVSNVLVAKKPAPD